jgi:hypothetical protein
MHSQLILLIQISVSIKKIVKHDKNVNCKLILLKIIYKKMKQAISELKYNLVHVSFLVLNLIGFAWMWTHATDWHFFVKYFSNQSFELAIVYSIVSLIKHTRESRITQILHELSFTYNIITCLGYWIVVRPYIINIISCNYLSHILV